MRRGIRKGVAPREPAVGVSGRGLESADRRLLEGLDRDYRDSAERAGSLLVCGPGCSDCCHGPFPVTRLDAWRLSRGLERVEARDPGRARAIGTRASRAVQALRPDYPGDPESGRLRTGEAELDRYLALHPKLACPALDPVTGQCELYDWRPVSCRNYGPPLSFGGEKSAPCPLCFRDAAVEKLERCRMEPDRNGLEESLLHSMGAVPGEPWETLIAFVLAGSPQGKDVRQDA